jgi:hypothetical protein
MVFTSLYKLLAGFGIAANLVAASASLHRSASPPFEVTLSNSPSGAI